MARKIKYVISISLLILISLYIYSYQERIKIDGFSGEIWGFLRTPDTKYADGYSHEKFNQIEIGMTEQQVLTVLGEPLYKWLPYKHSNESTKKNYIGFGYSESPNSTHYRIRQINFDNGIVVEKKGFFWVD